MSYDIYLEVDTGADEPTEVWWRNYTSNVAGMWRKAMPGTDGLAGLDGLAASDAVPHLERGGFYFDTNEALLKTMNPENGWGDYEGARDIVMELLVACRRHPKTKVAISR